MSATGAGQHTVLARNISDLPEDRKPKETG